MTTDGRGTRMPHEQRRRQILDEAVWVVGQHGYYGFSIQDLADRCGLTVAGVLHYFHTKVELLVALLEDRDRRDVAVAAESAGLAADGDWSRLGAGMSRDQVLTFLRRTVERNSTQPEIVRLYSMLRTESLYAGHPAYEYFRARDERVLVTFARMLTGKVADPRSTARQLLALMGGLEEQWLRTPDAFDPVSEWDRAVAKLVGPARRQRRTSPTTSSDDEPSAGP
jgi:AcrR family transcriptional regulator